MTLQSSLEVFSAPVKQHGKQPYPSRQVVFQALKDWGFTVDEYSKIPYSEGEYKAWLNGQLGEKTLEQQEFLKTMFAVKFSGSSANPNILVHFRVRRGE